MSDFLDGKPCAAPCNCSDCAAFLAKELERVQESPLEAAIAAAVDAVHRDLKPDKSARAHGDHDWPASPLSTTDALGYSRDAAELARSQGMSLAQWLADRLDKLHELTSSRLANDSPNEPPTPVREQLCACGAAYGRWSKVHWKPDAKQGDRPCEGSW